MRHVQVVGVPCRWSRLQTTLLVAVAATFQPFLIAEPLVSGQGESRPGGAQGLACVQNALGGVRAIAGVASLRMVSDTKPAASTGARPLPGTREIKVVLPDRYQRVDVGKVPGPGSHGLTSMIGFDRIVILSSPRTPDDAAAMRSARLDFARQMLMRLPRALPGVSVSHRVARDGGQQRVAIDASGPDGFRATLFADTATCVPIALQYEGSNRTSTTTVRIDLSEYREFGGIRFPTVLKTSDGVPLAEERVTLVEVNAPNAHAYFPPRR